MTTEKSIPKATAKRLSLYYRIFKRFNTDNVEKVSSKQIADAMGIDSATVRRDFSYFGELGRRGFGYDVKKLMNFFADILNDHSMTIQRQMFFLLVAEILDELCFTIVSTIVIKCKLLWLLILTIMRWWDMKHQMAF